MGFGLTLSTTNRWPGGIIPFQIDATAFPTGSAQRQQLINAINAWNNASIIRLTPFNGEADFALFTSGAACRTQTGRQPTGGQHNITCLVNAVAGNFMHEIGHCIGLRHEHQRPDRNQFVTVNNANIQAPSPTQPNPAGNFAIDNTNCPLGRYDCGSIMHYGQNAFGTVVGGVAQQTITINDTTICPAIGQRNSPSARDIAAARALYESITGLANKVALADTSDRSPAIASDGIGRIFIAWKGSGNENLNLMVSRDGGLTFTGKFVSAETSDDSPALMGGRELDGRIFMAWRGSGNENLNVAKTTFQPRIPPPIVT
jgi:Astacin (Peptidase family M12A)